MSIKKEYQLYKLGELLYKRAYKVYQPIYFFWKGYKDREKIKILAEYIKPGMTVVDIGANIGFYSVLFSKLVGEKGKVYAFEPDKENFKRLTSNAKKFKNIIPNNLAVSDKSGKIKFYHCDINVDHQTYDNGEGRSFTEIDGVSLDDFFKNGESIDMLKTDTQGFDYFVICGMKELIKKSKQMVLITEFWPFGLGKSGVHPEKLVSELKEMGFVLTFMDANAAHSSEKMMGDWNYYTDIIATKAPQ